MENATKALLIAGAVLVVIVLISVGVAVLNSTKGMQQQVSSSSETMAVSTFNSQFTEFLGKNVPGVNVKILVSRVKASNAKSSHKIRWSSYGINPEEHPEEIISGQTYDISIAQPLNRWVYTVS